MITRKVSVVRFNRGKASRLDDSVIEEDWMELFLNDHPVMSTPVTPKETDELVYGSLYVLGYIEKGQRIAIEKRSSKYYVTLENIKKVKRIKTLVEEAWKKRNAPNLGKNQADAVKYPVEVLLDRMRDFNKLPSVYHETGGVHMAAFSTLDSVLFWSDDISRRNVMDKTIGKLFLSSDNYPSGFILSSGRVSSDIVMRLILLKIPLIVSVSAPTVKALELAKAYGVTVCGFARGQRINVYSHHNRIIFP